MFFEALQRLGSQADRVMMVPASMLEPDMENSSDAYMINKARDEYSVKIVPITIHTHWAGEGKKHFRYLDHSTDNLSNLGGLVHEASSVQPNAV